MKTLSTMNTAKQKSKRKMITLIVGQLAIATSANAGLIVDISNAVAGTSQDYKNTPNKIIGKKDGYFGANIFTDNAQSTDITVEFLGSQAKWDIWFTLNGDDESHTIHNHFNGATGTVKANNTNRQQGTVTVDANKLLDFTFYIDDKWKGKSYDWTVKNGSNSLPTSLNPANSGAYFWTGFEYDQSGNISAIILGLDDSGAAFDEDNDDLMIRMTGFNQVVMGRPTSTPEVPLPASALLLGSALGMLSMLRKKKI